MCNGETPGMGFYFVHKRPKKFQNLDQRFLLKSKNWTTLVNSTNGQIQCAKHGEPNHAASYVKFGQ
jgi:hypothetical protein